MNTDILAKFLNEANKTTYANKSKIWSFNENATEPNPENKISTAHKRLRGLKNVK